MSGLEAGGRLFGEAAEGRYQGDPKAGGGFAITLQPSLFKLDEACRQGGGMAWAGWDDVVAVGPAEVVIPAVLEMAREVEERCNLKFQPTKSQIFS